MQSVISGGEEVELAGRRALAPARAAGRGARRNCGGSTAITEVGLLDGPCVWRSNVLRDGCATERTAYAARSYLAAGLNVGDLLRCV
jgi:hypothetical protein